MGAERAKKGEDSVGARRRHEGGKGALEGAGRLGSPLPSRTALAAAERRPDVGEQPRNGGYSNLRTLAHSRQSGGAAGWWRLAERAPERPRGRKCASQGEVGKPRRVY